MLLGNLPSSQDADSQTLTEEAAGRFIWGHYIGFHTYSFRPFMVNEFEDIKSFNSPQFANGREVSSSSMQHSCTLTTSHLRRNRHIRVAAVAAGDGME